MNKFTFIILFSIYLLSPDICDAADRGQAEVIELTKPDDIRDASTIDQAIVKLSNKVMECVQSKLAPANDCYCHYPQEFSNVRKTYEGTIAQHSDWKNKIVSYTREGKSYAVSFDGLSRQLERKCSQSK